MTQSDTQATIVAKKRESKLNKTAKLEVVPANIYGLGSESQSVTLDRKSFQHFMFLEYQGGMLYVQVEGAKKKEPVLVDEIQMHPYKQSIQHVSFRRVNLKEKIEQTIPVEMVGEADVPNAEIMLTMQEMTINALPTDIPESIQVDISGITGLDDKIVLSEVEAPEGCELVFEEEMADSAVVIVQEHKEEVEPEPTEEGEAAEGGEEGEAAEGDAEASTGS